MSKALRAIPQFANTVWGIGGVGGPPPSSVPTMNPTVQPTVTNQPIYRGLVIGVEDGITKGGQTEGRSDRRLVVKTGQNTFTADGTLAGVPGTGAGGGSSHPLIPLHPLTLLPFHTSHPLTLSHHSPSHTSHTPSRPFIPSFILLWN